jgi:hypothetical protein
MAGQDPWWLIGYKPIGSSSQWTFLPFQGTRAQAEAKQHLAVDGTLDGPFSTRAEARGAEKKERTTPIPQIGTPPGIGNPLSGIERVGAVLEAADRQLTDAALWRSLGWIALGVILIVLGLVLWLRKSGVIPDVVPVPV